MSTLRDSIVFVVDPFPYKLDKESELSHKFSLHPKHVKVYVTNWSCLKEGDLWDFKYSYLKKTNNF